VCSSDLKKSGLKKSRVGVITDIDALISHLKADTEFVEFLQKRVDAAARAKFALPGMTIKEVLK